MGILNNQLFTYMTALLSSSCCLLQLVLNSLSIPCAGFAIFTPYRSLLTTITILLLSHSLYNKGFKNRLLFSAMISLGLMISPEIVQHINQRTIIAPALDTTAYYYRIHLSGLGCEACANRIKNVLFSVDWIQDVHVYFNNQTAIIHSSKCIEKYTEVENLIKSIDIDKYNAQVLDSWAL